MEPVLAVPEIEDEDVVLTIERGHSRLLNVVGGQGLRGCGCGSPPAGPVAQHAYQQFMNLGASRFQRVDPLLGPAHDHRALDRGDDETGQPPGPLRRQPVVDEHGPERVAPAGEDRGRGTDQLRGVVVGLHRYRHDRATGAELAADQAVAPQREEGVDGLQRVVGLGGGLDQAGDEGAGERHRLLDQLRASAGKVVVDRAARGPAVREDAVDTRRGRPVLAQQRRGAEHHALAALTPARTHRPVPAPERCAASRRSSTGRTLLAGNLWHKP